jgi:replicative DNA helicase
VDFTSNIALIKLMMNKDNYLNYRSYVKDDVLGQVQKDILASFGKYYDEFPEYESVVLQQYSDWFYHAYKPDLDDDQRKLYTKVLNDTKNTDNSIIEKIVIGFNAQLTKDKIEQVCEQGFDIDQVKFLCEQHQEVITKLQDKKEYFQFSEDNLTKTSDRSKGLHWRLPCLNHCIGGVMPGDLIMVAAYVEIGKTTFMTSEISHMAQQMHEGTILWLNNEEPDERISHKLIAATLARPVPAVQQNIKTALEHYEKRMHGDRHRVKIINIRDANIYQLEAMVKKHKPSMVVVDMADKVTFPKMSDELQRLAKLYGKYRSIGIKYECGMIVTSHTVAPNRDKDGNVLGSHYLTIDKISSNKTAKPGEADVIITLAKDDAFPHQRFLHIAKNKVKEGDDKDKYIKKEITYNQETSRFE